MSTSNEQGIENLAYVDIQHDALAVFDDIEQSIVLSEDIWVSGYKSGESSVHGKAKITVREGGGVDIKARDGVMIERVSKTNFNVSIPGLSIQNRCIKFPKQIINPPYKKSSNLDAPLHINSISINPKSPHVVIGGPDGYCTILPTSLNSSEKEVRLKGHVGDVRDVKWFPSGQVILTASSDLSIRIYGKDGINPRTLKGHTRAITSTHILGVGKQILSSSKDGTVRLWDVGKAQEIKRWLIGNSDTGRKGVEEMIVLQDPKSLTALDLNGKSDEGVMVLNVQDGIWIQPFNLNLNSDDNDNVGENENQDQDDKGWFVKNEIQSQLVSIASVNGILVMGYQNGSIEIIDLERLKRPSNSTSTSASDPSSASSSVPELEEKKGRIKRIRRNESPIYSLFLTPPSPSSSNISSREQINPEEPLNLYIGTASGLPCLLTITPTSDGFEVDTKEEVAGWEATGIESWDLANDGSIWCAGGEGGIRRYQVD